VSHQYIFGIVKKVLNGQNKDIIGDNPFLVLGEIYIAASLEIFSVPDPLRDVIRENDFFIGDLPTKEVVKIIRGTTREQIDNIYKDLMQRAQETMKRGAGAGTG
jgi:hypothetical protein